MPCTPLRVSEFTDDAIFRVHLHLCLLDVRFIAESSVKVDAQINRYTGVVVFGNLGGLMKGNNEAWTARGKEGREEPSGGGIGRGRGSKGGRGARE